jgi:hypothetical protein
MSNIGDSNHRWLLSLFLIGIQVMPDFWLALTVLVTLEHHYAVSSQSIHIHWEGARGRGEK